MKSPMPKRLQWSRRVCLTACLGVTLLAPQLAQAAAKPAAPKPANAAGAAPDFSGFWQILVDRKAPMPQAPKDLPEGWRTFTLNGLEPPPLQPWAYEATKKQRLVENAAVDVNDGVDPQTAKCTPAGMPDFMFFPLQMDVMQRSDEVLIAHERERTLPRHIYIGPAHKPNKDHEDLGLPNPNGRSVGHWEGRELVVDTAYIDAEPWLLTFDRIPHSGEIHVAERIHLDPATGLLVDDMVITDEKAFTKPWKVKLQYRKLPPGTETIAEICIPSDQQPRH